MVLKLVKVLLVCFGELAVILGFFVFTGVHVSVRGLFQAGLLTGCGRKSQISRDFYGQIRGKSADFALISRTDSGKSQSQRRNDTAVVLHQTAGNSVLTGQTQS